MDPPLNRASSTWFSSLVALLVAIGSQTALEAIIPAGFAESLSLWVGDSTIYRAGAGAFWPSETVIRFVSFVFAGFVAVCLAASFSWRLVALLIFVATAATVFHQYPGRPSPLWLGLWSLAGPIGVVLGAWVASAKRPAA